MNNYIKHFSSSVFSLHNIHSSCESTSPTKFFPWISFACLVKKDANKKVVSKQFQSSTTLQAATTLGAMVTKSLSLVTSL